MPTATKAKNVKQRRIESSNRKIKRRLDQIAELRKDCDELCDKLGREIEDEREFVRALGGKPE